MSGHSPISISGTVESPTPLKNIEIIINMISIHCIHSSSIPTNSFIPMITDIAVPVMETNKVETRSGFLLPYFCMAKTASSVPKDRSKVGPTDSRPGCSNPIEVSNCTVNIEIENVPHRG